MAQTLRIPQDAFIGKTWQELGFPSEVTARCDIERDTVSTHSSHWQGELIFPTEGGQPSAVQDVLGTARDISERKQTGTALHYQALHDISTGLANRAVLDDRLEQALLMSRRIDHPLAVLFLDLNDFTLVNDTVGHLGGNLVLQQLARRWSRMQRGSDTLARVEGDEFVLLLPGTAGSGAYETAQRLRAEIDQPFEIEGHQLQVGVSIGIAIHHGVGGNANALVREADGAMYQVKRQRRARSTSRA